MLMALLKGKLSREQENMEDILTSNVFGLLQYLSPKDCLLPFLRLAQTPEGNKLLEELPDNTQAEPYDFWPSWHEEGCEGCQPDVVLRLNINGQRRLLVLIEAKYYSGKSSEEDREQECPNDQLAREWDNLVRVAAREKREPVLVYLTADMGIPKDEIEVSQREYRVKRGKQAVIAWISWRHLAGVLSGAQNPSLQDLRKVLERLNLVFFSGFSAIGRAAPVDWTYEGSSLRYGWGISTIPSMKWRYIP